MKVTISNLYSGHSHDFVGSEKQIAFDILQAYGDFIKMRIGNRFDLGSILRAIAHQQAFQVEVDKDLKKAEDQQNDHIASSVGHVNRLEAVIEAARFLVGRPAPSQEGIHEALWEADGDEILAGLLIAGLEDTEDNRKALESIVDIKALGKSEEQQLKHVVAATPDAEQVAASVQKAVDAQLLEPIKLVGKHSQGMMLAKDPDGGGTWLLKPGYGNNSPAAGVNESGASQSQREAAFSAVMKLWGLENSAPIAYLLLIDGRQYAVAKLLGWEYKNLDKRRKLDQNLPSRVLDPYRHTGQLHKWAVLDYVLGNPDRHAQNMMVNGVGDVKLIDHGSAFAGNAFDPSFDKRSFIPFYLRYKAPSSANFSAIGKEDKLRYMEKAPESARAHLKTWLDRLDPEALEVVLPRYGIDPSPEVNRLKKVKNLAATIPVDEAINGLWAGT